MLDSNTVVLVALFRFEFDFQYYHTKDVLSE